MNCHSLEVMTILVNAEVYVQVIHLQSTETGRLDPAQQDLGASSVATSPAAQSQQGEALRQVVAVQNDL